MAAWAGFYALFFVLPRNTGIQFFVTSMFIAYGLHAIFKIQTAIQATGRLAEEAAGGGLELLLSTPLTIREIIAGHHDAVSDAIQRDKRRLAVVNLLLSLSILNPRVDIGGREAHVFLTIFLGGLVLIWVDTFAIIRLGAWSAVRTRRQSRAMWYTLLPTFLPTPVGVLTIFLIESQGLFSNSITPFFALFTGFVVCAVIFGVRAAARLAADFRSTAAGTGR